MDLIMNIKPKSVTLPTEVWCAGHLTVNKVNKIFKINLLKSLDMYESTHTRRNTALTNKDSECDFSFFINKCLMSVN